MCHRGALTRTNAHLEEECHMGLLDKLKGLLGGNKNKVKTGIDKVSDVVESKVGEKNADKVEMAAAKAKDAVDKLGS